MLCRHSAAWHHLTGAAYACCKQVTSLAQILTQNDRRCQSRDGDHHGGGHGRARAAACARPTSDDPSSCARPGTEGSLPAAACQLLQHSRCAAVLLLLKPVSPVSDCLTLPLFCHPLPGKHPIESMRSVWRLSVLVNFVWLLPLMFGTST